MIKSRLIIYGSLIFCFMNFSCDYTKKDSYNSFDIQLDAMFYELGKNVDKDCLLLEQLIIKDLSVLKENNEKYNIGSQINSEFKQYYDYLTYVDSISSINQRNEFFTEGQLNSEGLIFLEKSKIILSKMNSYIKNDDLLERIDLLLGIDDVQNEDGVYLKYLDYYYNGVPQNTFSYLIKNRKRDLLLIEREILTILK
ncbi:hypothetical protein M2306_001019 [Myroides gitamensis]|uniref:hypothetical protein n=1 Tax=Myroides odoratus TaxID=256 RepID=UPI0021683514|nr:hypothetical protein [Myroides odoratus]MCS4240306.1 hypothetical protein [Myroides odoratus]MDH6600325.1 hypothetical protein [Myroides gitamensis]